MDHFYYKKKVKKEKSFFQNFRSIVHFFSINNRQRVSLVRFYTLKTIICEYLGSRPNPHSGPNWSKVLEGKRPRPRLPHECRTNPPSGYFKGIKPRHLLAHGCLTDLPPGHLGTSWPGRLDAYFPERQFS